jgi:hypothetical protein
MHIGHDNNAGLEYLEFDFDSDGFTNVHRRSYASVFSPDSNAGDPCHIISRCARNVWPFTMRTGAVPGIQILGDDVMNGTICDDASFAK